MTPPPPPSQLGAGLQPEFDAVVAKGMAKNPDDRYQTAMDLARAARGAANGADSTKTPPQGLPLLTRFAPNDTPPTVPTEPRVVDPAFAETQMRSPSQQPTDTPPPVPSRRWPTAAIVLAVVLAVVATVAVVAAFVGNSGDNEAKSTLTVSRADLDGSGWTAVRGETYKGPRESGSPTARQSVVEMPNAELAKKLVDRFTGTWQPCNGKIYTQESGSRWQSTVTPGDDRTTAMALE